MDEKLVESWLKILEPETAQWDDRLHDPAPRLDQAHETPQPAAARSTKSPRSSAGKEQIVTLSKDKKTCTIKVGKKTTVIVTSKKDD